MKPITALIFFYAVAIAASTVEARETGYPNGRGWQMVKGDFEEVEEKVDGVQATADEINEGVADIQETLSNPLEVTGTVDANVSGSVDVSGSSVVIDNTEAEPVPTLSTDDGNREIFSREIVVSFGNGSGACNHDELIEVPEGKRIVITYVSGTAFLPMPAALIFVGLSPADPAASGRLLLVPANPPVPAVSFGNLDHNFSAAGQNMLAYFDSNLMACANGGSPSSGIASIQVLGYYVEKI